MEVAHVRQRWAPQITERCDVLSEKSVHVAFDEPKARSNVSVALIAYAPQTARLNCRRHAPDYIRRGSHTETRVPHQKRPCISKLLYQHPDLSPEQQHGRPVVQHTHTHRYTRPSTLQCVFTHTCVLTRYLAASASIPTTTAHPRRCSTCTAMIVARVNEHCDGRYVLVCTIRSSARIAVMSMAVTTCVADTVREPAQ